MVLERLKSPITAVSTPPVYHGDTFRIGRRGHKNMSARNVDNMPYLGSPFANPERPKELDVVPDSW